MADPQPPIPIQPATASKWHEVYTKEPGNLHDSKGPQLDFITNQSTTALNFATAVRDEQHIALISFNAANNVQLIHHLCTHSTGTLLTGTNNMTVYGIMGNNVVSPMLELTVGQGDTFFAKTAIDLPTTIASEQ